MAGRLSVTAGAWSAEADVGRDGGGWRDLRSQPHADVLDYAERWLGLVIDRAGGIYGGSGRTAGFRTDQGTWLRLQWRPEQRVNCQAWSGLECASALVGVARPDLLRSVRWRDDARNAVWRADEMTLASSAVIDPSGSVAVPLDLPQAWWDSLSRSLVALAGHQTGRTGMRQEHLTARISEVYGDGVDTVADEWTTAHADLHWGNLTAPECSLLDWEDWGAAPRGLDAATLWGFSLGVPSLAGRIEREFQVDLGTRSGKLARLLFCANAARAFARHGKEMPFTGPARQAAAVLLSDLDRR